MTSVVLMILAAAWAAFLIPPLIRRARSGELWGRRRTRRGMGLTIRSVHPRLAERGAMAAPVVALRPYAGISPPRYATSMASTSPRIMPRSSIDARRRRRRILVTLIVGALVSFVMAIYWGGPALVAHLVIDAMLLAYAMLLVQYQRTREERLRPVEMDTSVPQPRRAVSGGQR